MGINSTEVAYGFGQMGSVYATTGNVKPPKGMVIVSITSLADSTYFSTLTDERAGVVQGVDVSAASHDLSGADEANSATTNEGEGGVVFGNQLLTSGVSIYGRWTAVTAAAGSYIAYFGL